MRIIQLIGVFNILIGATAFIIPVKFYSIAVGMFTPLVYPPFSMSAIQIATLLLFFPGLVLVLIGIALVVLGSRLSRTPVLKTFTESGEYIGELSGVEMKEGEVEKFEVGREEPEVLHKERVTGVDDVVIVKKEDKQHKFVGKEVYSELGEYLGKVDSVNTGEGGEISEFTAVRGNSKNVVTYSDVASVDEVIIVKSE